MQWGLIENTPSVRWRICVNKFKLNDGGPIFGAFRTEYGQGYIVGSTPINNGVWHHVASGYDGSGYGDEGSIKLYVDGKRERISFIRRNEINTVIN